MKKTVILLTTLLLLHAAKTRAQTAAPARLHNNLTILYDINTAGNKKNTGIEETYNGGIKTIMVQNGRARVRLVSLMRIQSHYFIIQDSALVSMSIIKESGKKKYKYNLTAAQWQRSNTRYDSASCTLLQDTRVIAGYTCKKAILKLPAENKEIILYYTPVLKPLDKFIEPMFASVPGIVLHYETSDGSLSFTARTISFEQLDESLLQEPTTGYSQREYNSGM